MYKSYAVMLLSFLVFISCLGASVLEEYFSTQDPGPGDYVIQIVGFQQFPDATFYQVSEKNAFIAVKRIRTNVVQYINNINPNTTRISYNPKLKSLNEQIKYDVNDMGLVLDDNLNLKADEVIVNRSGGLRGFSAITDYYRVKQIPSQARNKDIDYTLVFIKRVYDTSEYSIIASGNLNCIPNFIKNNITMNSLLVTGSRLRFSSQQLKTLRDFVRKDEKTHWIDGEPGKHDQNSDYAWEHTNIQNIKFADEMKQRNTDDKPSLTPPKTTDNKGNLIPQKHRTRKEIYALRFWIAMICSILIESAIMILLVLKYIEFEESDWLKGGEVFLITALGTGFTFPVIWWVFILPGFSHSMYIFISEVFAILVEGWWFSLMLRLPSQKAYLFSLAANLASWWCGIILFEYILNWIY